MTENNTDKNCLSYALSDNDVKALLKGYTKIVPYSDLHKYKSINQLLKPYDSAVILYESEPNFGHWVSLIKRKKSIEFFDPYGFFPDDELKWIKPLIRIQNNADHTYLINLLLTSKIPIEYNNHALQGENPNIQTCGRWSVIRILFKNWNIDKFSQILNSDHNLTGDQIVTQVTNFIAHKIGLW